MKADLADFFWHPDGHFQPSVPSSEQKQFPYISNNDKDVFRLKMADTLVTYIEVKWVQLFWFQDPDFQALSSFW